MRTEKQDGPHFPKLFAKADKKLRKQMIKRRLKSLREGEANGFADIYKGVCLKEFWDFPLNLENSSQ